MRRLLLALALTATAQAQFQILPTPTTADLRGIHAVSPEIAWASGTNGTVLRTTDAGATWTLCATPPGAEHLDFRGIQAFDAQTAIVMSSGRGPLSRLYKTTDACATWSLLFTNPDPEGFWDAIQFQHEKAANTDYFTGGVLIGDPVKGRFPTFTTGDYGSTWHILGQNDLYFRITPAEARPGECLFAASNSALTATADGNTFAFVTGGNGGARLIFPEGHSFGYDVPGAWYKFAEIALPIPANETSGAFAVASRRTTDDYNRVDLMVVGGDYKNPEIGSAVFVRHGASGYKKLFERRVVRPQTPPHGYRSSVAYSPTHKTWITVGPNGTDISTDDGRNWRALKPSSTDAPDADRNWNALYLPYVVGPHGRIGKLRPSALQPQH